LSSLRLARSSGQARSPQQKVRHAQCPISIDVRGSLRKRYEEIKNLSKFAEDFFAGIKKRGSDRSPLLFSQFLESGAEVKKLTSAEDLLRFGEVGVNHVIAACTGIGAVSSAVFGRRGGTAALLIQVAADAVESLLQLVHARLHPLEVVLGDRFA
jgi:hypothetical protein